MAPVGLPTLLIALRKRSFVRPAHRASGFCWGHNVPGIEHVEHEMSREDELVQGVGST